MATNKENFYVMNFADASNLFADWVFMMPGDWNVGTLSAYFAWTCSAY
jgi:hypothetical protein